MTVVSVDLVNPESSERPAYEPLEPGVYTLRITNRLEVKPSQNPSSDGINHGRVEVILVEEETGKTIKDYIPMSPKMKWKLNQFTKAAGVTEVEPDKVDLDDFQDQVVTAEVGQESYARNDGTTGLSNKIRNYIYE